MKVGIIVYPGSNCDKDTYNYFTHHGCECFYIWHKEDQLEKHIDLAQENDLPIMGVCRGMQVIQNYYNVHLLKFV